MDILKEFTEAIKKALSALYTATYTGEISFQKTRKEFEGEVTLVTFPLIKTSGKSPEITGNDIGNYLQQNTSLIKGFNVVKGFLNFSVADKIWLAYFADILEKDTYALESSASSGSSVMIEYPSP